MVSAAAAGATQLSPTQIVTAQAHDRELVPVRESERIRALDVLRGFALFGIFMVNLPFFALPLMQVLQDPGLADAPVGEQLAWAFVRTFFQYKFVSLFSLLFGIGFAVQLVRARARHASDRAFLGRYALRLGVLLAFGLIHGLLLWYGDILTFYAVLGVSLIIFGFLSARALIGLSAGALVVAIVLGVGCGSMQFIAEGFMGEEYEQRLAEAEVVAASEDAPRGHDAMQQAQYEPINPIWMNAETIAYRHGPFSDAFLFRSASFGFSIFFAMFGFGWHVLAMFLLGAALMKLDFFASHRQTWHRNLAMIALPVGLALEALVSLQAWFSGFDPSWMSLVMHLVTEIGSVSLCLGYVGLICLAVSGGWLRPLAAGLAAVGRMSLTNYLLQTAIATSLMYWWGLGWFGQVNRVQMIGLAVVIFIGQIVFSVLWLRVFQTGPLEWLWRTVTYMRPQPLVRRAPTLPSIAA